jgi:hypothetical protein
LEEKAIGFMWVPLMGFALIVKRMRRTMTYLFCKTAKSWAISCGDSATDGTQNNFLTLTEKSEKRRTK